MVDLLFASLGLRVLTKSPCTTGAHGGITILTILKKVFNEAINIKPMLDYAARDKLRAQSHQGVKGRWRCRLKVRLSICLLSVRRDVFSRPLICLPRSKASARARRLFFVQRMGSH